jgi:hypothetical protein
MGNACVILVELGRLNVGNIRLDRGRRRMWGCKLDSGFIQSGKYCNVFS